MCTAPMGANVNYAMDYIIAQCLSSRHCTIMGANVEQRQDTYKTRTRYKAIYYEIPTKLKINKTEKNCLPCVEVWKNNVAMTRV
mmetsp:Transcript_696/g.881  ORF Transcript_696/g.881 Transcript_696/m.881 type:complete len:84 (+) Transcript_696:2073-2324(+)